MLKSDLIDAIKQQYPDLKGEQPDLIVHLFFDAIEKAVRQGNRVEIRGFGAFSLRVRRPRQARNPKTGVKVSIPEKRVPFWKTGKELAELLNGNRQEVAQHEALAAPVSSQE